MKKPTAAPGAQPTLTEISSRLERAQLEVSAQNDAHQAAHANYEAAVVAGENELAISRARKSAEDAKAAAAEAQERADLLTAALDDAIERDVELQRQAKIRKADRLLSERAKECEKLESLLCQVGACVTKISELSRSATAALPERMEWAPPMFTQHGLTQRIGLRLYALTDGALRMASNSSNVWEAQQMPNLAKHGADERTNVLAQYGAKPARRPNLEAGAAVDVDDQDELVGSMEDRAPNEIESGAAARS